MTERVFTDYLLSCIRKITRQHSSFGFLTKLRNSWKYHGGL